MDESFPDAVARSETYATDHSLSLVARLGHGNDGTVWQSNRQSAVKVFHRDEAYFRERDCYRRLFEAQVHELVRFRIPQLLDYDNRLLVVEISIVFPPCVIDFGKAYPGQPPGYSAETLAEVEAAEQELFTDDEWKQVRLVRAALLNYGIHYFDARPSNIMFPRRRNAV